MYLLLIVMALGIRHSVAEDKFDLYFIQEYAEDSWEYIIQSLSPLSYHQSVKTIRDFNLPANNTAFMRNANLIKRSSRSQIVFISNHLFSNIFVNFRAEYTFIFISHSLQYNNKLPYHIMTSKVIFFGENGISIPCILCHKFIFVHRHIFSFDIINSIWHRHN